MLRSVQRPSKLHDYTTVTATASRSTQMSLIIFLSCSLPMNSMASIVTCTNRTTLMFLLLSSLDWFVPIHLESSAPCGKQSSRMPLAEFGLVFIGDSTLLPPLMCWFQIPLRKTHRAHIRSLRMERQPTDPSTKFATKRLAHASIGKG